MFTGLVQTVGNVASVEGSRLTVRSTIVDAELGESVAVDGCCLTVVASESGALSFDLSEETLRRTTLGGLRESEAVNLERAMRLDDRLGGHIVQGHVDTVGEIVAIELKDGGAIVRFRVPAEYDRYLIDKGSIAIDGVSLTVIQPQGGEFEVAAIPHTLSSTSLREAKSGERVNVEFDVLAKHVEKLLSFRAG